VRSPFVYVLALETSGRVGSIALVESLAEAANAGSSNLKAANVIEERALPAGERTARSLLPSIQRLLAEHSRPPASLDLIATTTGPGSFTGLRIGVVAAKTLAYSLGVKLVGVHTLAAMAANITAANTDVQSHPLWTILDAQREELFAARFEPDVDLAAVTEPATEILGIADWLARLQPGDAVAGPPLAKLRERLPAGVEVVDEALWQPSAAATGRLAIELAQRGIETPPLELVPHYYRRSAAEEKAALA
jgi:tRNA threonylcarbamoyladenosine biosynthesis protein TsaB